MHEILFRIREKLPFSKQLSNKNYSTFTTNCIILANYKGEIALQNIECYLLKFLLIRLSMHFDTIHAYLN